MALASGAAGIANGTESDVPTADALLHKIAKKTIAHDALKVKFERMAADRWLGAVAGNVKKSYKLPLHSILAIVARDMQ
jgi:hypothetical protein